jgi:hypothetical protein
VILYTKYRKTTRSYFPYSVSIFFKFSSVIISLGFLSLRQRFDAGRAKRHTWLWRLLKVYKNGFTMVNVLFTTNLCCMSSEYKIVQAPSMHAATIWHRKAENGKPLLVQTPVEVLTL